MMFALVVVTIVAVVALAQRYRSQERGITEYLTVADSVASTESDAARDLGELLSSMPQMQRPELLRRLGLLMTATGAARDELAGLDIPPATATANGFLTAATRSWANAATGLEDAVTTIIDDPGDTSGVVRLAGALDLFRVGDVAYEGFLEAVGELDEGLVPAELPEVRFVDPGSPFDAQLLTLQLQSTYRLGEHVDVSVTASTTPAPAGTDGTTPVLPFAQTIGAQVVVANVGNEPTPPITVTLTLVPSADGEAVTLQQSLASLDAAQAGTVEFGDIAVVPGVLYELTATAATDGDVNPDDNAWKMVFIMNENL